ncbi:MAG: hydantoinase B/oxoprolinase family protein, partial [Nitrososphaerales archaeon]
MSKPMESTAQKSVDPVTLAILRDRLLAISSQMISFVEFASPSFITGEVLDITTGVFASNGDALASGAGLPNHSLGYAQVKELITQIKEICEGDVI